MPAKPATQTKTATKTPPARPAPSNDGPAWDWDTVRARAKDMPNVLPRLKLEAGQSADVQIESEEPYIVNYEDPEEGPKSFPVIDIVHLGNGQKMTLAVSAVSLQNGLGRIANDHGTLAGARVRVSCETYNHPKYGPNTKGYRVSEIVPVNTVPAQRA